MHKLLLSLLVVGTLGTGSPVTAAPAPPLNHPLKASQVECAERHLARVQRRMATYGSWINANLLDGNTTLDASGSVLALWHTSLGGGIFSGLARIVYLGDACRDFLNGQQHFTETDLGFELLFKERSDVLDPRQPRIPQATLVRRGWSTNFQVDHPPCYEPNDGSIIYDLTCPTILSLDLAARARDQLKPQRPIYLNSASQIAPGRTGPGAQPLADATGRGPGILGDDLAQACGGALTDFDQRVFEILARTILPSYYFATLPPPQICNDTFLWGHNLAIFRGADPHIYRVNVYSYISICCDDNGNNGFGNTLGAALEFKMNWDSQGRLTTGTVRILPRCRRGQDVGCTPELGGIALFIVPPIFPGHEEAQPSAFHNAPYLQIRSFDLPPSFLSATVNWADLLKNTALNSPYP